jgi:hypothetical protein
MFGHTIKKFAKQKNKHGHTESGFEGEHHRISDSRSHVSDRKAKTGNLHACIP